MTREQFITKHATGGILGDESALKLKLAFLAGLAYDSLKFKGAATAAVIAAAVEPMNGDTYVVATTGGTLNTAGDAITTTVGDVVYYNEPTGLWAFLVNVA
jgi:hypothetical protein